MRKERGDLNLKRPFSKMSKAELKRQKQTNYHKGSRCSFFIAERKQPVMSFSILCSSLAIER